MVPQSVPDRTTSDAADVADPRTVVTPAEDAFWEIVRRAYPSATTGDLSPMTEMTLADALHDAVREWVYYNVPGIHDHGTEDDQVPPGISGVHFLGTHAHPFEEGDNHVHLTHDRATPYAHDPETLYDDRETKPFPTERNYNDKDQLIPGWTCRACEPGEVAARS